MGDVLPAMLSFILSPTCWSPVVGFGAQPGCRLRWQAEDISESTHVKSTLVNISGCLRAHTQTNTGCVRKHHWGYKVK